LRSACAASIFLTATLLRCASPPETRAASTEATAAMIVVSTEVETAARIGSVTVGAGLSVRGRGLGDLRRSEGVSLIVNYELLLTIR
jgi:hypothetical protein